MIPFLSAIPSVIASRVTYHLVKANGGSRTEAIAAATTVGVGVSAVMCDPLGGAAAHAATHGMAHAATHGVTQATVNAATHAATHTATHGVTHAATHTATHGVSHVAAHGSSHAAAHGSSHATTNGISKMIENTTASLASMGMDAVGQEIMKQVMTKAVVTTFDVTAFEIVWSRSGHEYGDNPYKRLKDLCTQPWKRQQFMDMLSAQGMAQGLSRRIMQVIEEIFTNGLIPGVA